MELYKYVRYLIVPFWILIVYKGMNRAQLSYLVSCDKIYPLGFKYSTLTWVLVISYIIVIILAANDLARGGGLLDTDG